MDRAHFCQHLKKSSGEKVARIFDMIAAKCFKCLHGIAEKRFFVGTVCRQFVTKMRGATQLVLILDDFCKQFINQLGILVDFLGKILRLGVA